MTITIQCSMRILLNTLYVTVPEAYLSKDGQNVVVSVEGQEALRVPIHNLEGIVSFSHSGASPGLMKLCADSGVTLSFLSPNGRFIGRFQGPVHGNVLLRRAQYFLSENEDMSLHLSQLFVAGKVRNYRNILRRCIRENGENAEVAEAATVLDRDRKKILEASSKESVRGIEGDAANAYFGVFSHQILNQKEYFSFTGRNKRPPRDAVNAMLSFAYSLIAGEVTAALETVGLDPYVGFLHTLRPGRPSLSLDLMEEFRAYLGDRLVLSLINRRQMTSKHFLPQGSEGISMTDEGRKIFLTAWQSRKREIVTHPYLNEKVCIGLLPYAQAMLLARYIRGDIDDYPVFLVP